MSVHNSYTDTDIVITGGGPVGLYLGGILGKMGYSVTILEKKKKIDPHSKSLGIHPVSLELFEEAGIAKRFRDDGIQIQQGIAFLDRERVGEINFKMCPKPFNFILALPQHRTEEILELWISKIETIEFIREAEVTAIDQKDEGVSVTFTHKSHTQILRCKYLVGCDGKNSTVRKEAGIGCYSKKYPDTYIMGDFSDNTDFGPDAAVYLHRDGLIESFPLPGSNRRWVVKTDKYIKEPKRENLEELILDRLDHNLSQQKNKMVSSFGVQQLLAETFYKGRIALAGDSAHVVSPIGGQGMNLGWLTAHRLANTLNTCFENSAEAESAFNRFNQKSRSIAKKVTKRAEINMWLGRKRRFPLVRNLITNLIVNTSLQKPMAGMFTMRRL